MLGCGGMMGGAHVPRFKKNPDVEIVALCDTKMEIVEKFRAKHFADAQPAPALFTDPAQMYAQAKPNAVIIGTPHTLHYEQACQALDAGCHVFVEKPMVTSAEQAYDLAERAEKSGKVFVVGYNTSCTPELSYIRDAIRNKTFGKLELVVGYLSQNWKKLTAGSWRQKPELSGGGQAYDSGAHLMNSLCWSVESDIAEVFAFIDNCGTPVDINSSISIRFASGVMASIAIGGNCVSDGSHMVFIFENGRIEVDGWGGSWMNVFGPHGKIKYPQVTAKQQTANDNFVDAILGRAQPMTSARNGVVHTELMDAIYESARTGKPAKPKRRKPENTVRQ